MDSLGRAITRPMKAKSARAIISASDDTPPFEGGEASTAAGRNALPWPAVAAVRATAGILVRFSSAKSNRSRSRASRSILTSSVSIGNGTVVVATAGNGSVFGAGVIGATGGSAGVLIGGRAAMRYDFRW